MATLVKVQAQWTGFQGATGYTNWYGLSDTTATVAADALGPRMRTFFNALAAYIPVGTSVKVQRLYQVVDSASGHLLSEAQLTADPAVVAGSAAVTYSGATGAVVSWETGQYNALGHKIRGRTYLVPLANCFSNGGRLATVAVSSLQSAASAAVGGVGGMVIWTRPPKGTFAGGIATGVTAAIVRDKAAVLRSRRD